MSNTTLVALVISSAKKSTLKLYAVGLAAKTASDSEQQQQNHAQSPATTGQSSLFRSNSGYLGHCNRTLGLHSLVHTDCLGKSNGMAAAAAAAAAAVSQSSIRRRLCHKQKRHSSFSWNDCRRCDIQQTIKFANNATILVGRAEKECFISIPILLATMTE